jgi:hypothetical protein
MAVESNLQNHSVNIKENEMTVSPEVNKINAQAFYDLMFNKCQPRAAIERHAGAVYIQHNPHVADGKAAFIDYFERMAREYPGKTVTSSGRLRRAITSFCIATRYGPAATTMQGSTFFGSMTPGRLSSIGTCFRSSRAAPRMTMGFSKNHSGKRPEFIEVSMGRILPVILLLILVVGVVFAIIIRIGLPMRALLPPNGNLIGAVNDLATDPSRPDLFSVAAQRVVPIQILYPASTPGTYAAYMPEAEPQIDAIVKSHSWISQVLLGQIGTLVAPWTDTAVPSAGGPFPVIIYLPGVTGYMQMGSFQTTALVEQGYVVVTLNQPGAVAAVVLPDRRIVIGLTREEAVSVIAPSYLADRPALPNNFVQKLAPQNSIVPYFAEDVPLVLDRLAQINTDPRHILHGLLDLDHVGLMGMSLGAIVTAQACATETRIDACLMMDAPVPSAVAAVGLRQAALWISRPKEDQRFERNASGGWPENEIDAQAQTIEEALSKSDYGQLVLLHGLFHLDFTDVPAVQPVLEWLGQSGPSGTVEAHRQINRLTTDFFAATFRQPAK